MLGTYYTFPELLLWIPFVTGLIAIFIKNAKSVKDFALFSSLATLIVSVISLSFTDVAHHPEYFNYNNVSYVWMPYIGSSFSVGLDGMGHVLTFLTAFSFPIIFAVTYKTDYKNANGFYALMLLFQAGLMGVFVSMDALLFYFFWELALIPAYFLCSRWGGEKRVAATFKFFVYTFVGSLLMLIGIIYVYQFTPAVTPDAAHSFSLAAFYSNALQPSQQNWVFWLFFAAFAVKMPIFPLHTWQPDTYEQAPYSTVMVLSGVMVKMGVFAMIRWLLPIVPEAVSKFDNLIIILSVIGIVYASCIAMVQDDLKRLVAWASIAHIGLMGAAIFSRNAESLQGVMLEILNHGINIIALWVIVELIDKTTGIRKISQLGGLAQKSPTLSIFFLIIALANIGLPLTNSFVSEFLMFTGLFHFNKWYAAFACVGVILSAVYMLNMMKNVFYGKMNALTENAKAISGLQKIVLSVIVIAILVLGIYPQLILRLTEGTVTDILTRVVVR
ncbi:MAG: NADH-quinone oxidoreductase subunit M [Bacteroidota bacterium]|nr:NADH-quinone oxidoreductase subunit M [Bacteroidota bacterium]